MFCLQCRDLHKKIGPQQDPKVWKQKSVSKIRGVSGRGASPGEVLAVVLVALVVDFQVVVIVVATTETMKRKATTRATKNTTKTSPGLFFKDVSVNFPNEISNKNSLKPFLKGLNPPTNPCKRPSRDEPPFHYAQNLVLVRIFRVDSKMLTSKFRFSHGLISNILVQEGPGGLQEESPPSGAPQNCHGNEL